MRVLRVRGWFGPVLSCALGVSVLGLSSVPAFAAEERGRVFGGAFGESQLSLSGPERSGLGERPGSGVAVNQATHDVYVVDSGNHRVVEFSSAGVLIRAWGWGVADGAAEAEVCTIACLPGIAGSAPGQFEAPAAIAADNAPGGEGDVYVADYAGFESPDSHVQKFTAEGVLIKSWGEEGQLGEGALTEGVGFAAVGGLAVGPSGDLFAGTANRVFEFERSDVLMRRLSSGGNAVGLAVDDLGDLYALNEGSLDVPKFDQAGVGQGVVLKVAQRPTGVVADSVREELLVDEGDAIASGPRSCSSDCTPVGHFGSPDLSGGAGLALDAESHTVYAADSAANRIDLFTLEPPGVPVVESESLWEVTASSATFGAQINPRSEPGEAATGYEFQYGPCATPTTCEGSGYEKSAPLPEGSIEADFEAHGVSVHVGGLLASRAYHFRILAHNSHGPVQGQERVFTTQGAGGALSLPDGREWEMVSPADKQGAIRPTGEAGVVQAALGGGAVSYLANAPTEAQPQGYSNEVQILSRRGPSGWSSRDIAIAHKSATGFAVGPGVEYKFFSADLSQSIVQPFGEFNAALSEEASESTAFLHSLSASCDTSCYRPLVSGKAGFANVEAGVAFGEDALCEPQAGGGSARVFCGPEFLGATEDVSHVVLRAKAELKAGAGIGQLYEWDRADGALTPVSVLAGGGAASGAQLGLNDIAAQRAISADGSRVVWKAEGKLYDRDSEGGGETIQLDEAEAGCDSCEGGGGSFQIASADGSRVLFTDTHKLSKDSGAQLAKESDLYECRIPPGKLSCELTDLTPETGGEAASVQGGLLGASEDGSWIYFVAQGVLSAAPNARGESALSGQANLYVRHGASTSFITTLADGDGHDWEQNPQSKPSRVSPNGEWVELMSEASLTGYDNRDVASGEPVAEVYLYDAVAKRLSCASCEPSGGRPTGVEYEKLEAQHGGLVGGVGAWSSTALVAANVPAWTVIATAAQQKSRHQPAYLANSGRLFFNSADGLVPQDSNNNEDVYQYEPPGVGDCTSESESFSAGSGGCVALISSGSSAQESAFLDASETGGDVFFLTSAKLSPQDLDAARDVYDAHLCTSEAPCLASSSVQPPPCTTEASCKASPTPQPPIFGAPASSTFSGPGNMLPAPPKPPVVKKVTKKAVKCAMGKKRRHGRCVKSKAKRKTNRKRRK